jgi:hypothetical protein
LTGGALGGATGGFVGSGTIDGTAGGGAATPFDRAVLSGRGSMYTPESESTVVTVATFLSSNAISITRAVT